MKADMLYKRLESDFVKDGMWDEWAIYMSELEEFLSEFHRAEHRRGV